MKNSTSPNPQVQVSQVAAQVEAKKGEATRRRFLKSAAGLAGGFALGLQAVTRADGETQSTPAATETVVPVPEKVLAKVGGFDVVETKGDKIIVVRTSTTSVAACSAVCSHKGCTVEYEAKSQELVCPCHGARFGLDGKVKQGPARRGLKSYNARFALGLSEKA